MIVYLVRLTVGIACIIGNWFILRHLLSSIGIRSGTPAPQIGRSLPTTTKGSDTLIKKGPQFVYLIQGHSVHDIPELKRGKNRDIIWLTYRDKSGDIYFPNSTFTQGRNRLLREAVTRSSKRDDGGYLYYIFMDDDVRLVSEPHKELWWRKQLPDNPYDRFEMFLLDFRPVVGFTRGPNDMQLRPGLKEVASVRYNFDACFNGFHRHALSFMLPYVEDLDHISWWFHQWYVIHLSAMLYHSYRVQINAVRNVNQRYHGNSKVKGDYRDSANFDIVRNYTLPWMAERSTVDSLNSGRVSLLRTYTKPAMYQYLPGDARKKGKMEYRVSTEFIRKAFNASHPAIQRILRWRALPTVNRILYGQYGQEKEEPKFLPDIFPI